MTIFGDYSPKVWKVIFRTPTTTETFVFSCGEEAENKAHELLQIYGGKVFLNPSNKKIIVEVQE